VVGYQENDKDIQTVCGLAEDIRDAVVEYQVSPDLLDHPQDARLRQPAASPTEGVVRSEL
jgi:hypothetical protein